MALSSSVIVACVHNCGGSPSSSSSSSTTHDVILATLLRHDYRLLLDIENRVEEIGIGRYGPINPYCDKCEESLLTHLTTHLSLSYFSAEHILHSLRQRVYHTHSQLVDSSKYDSHYSGPRLEEVRYGFNCYFKSVCDDDDDGFETGSYSERIIKVTTVDGGWSL